MALNPNSFMRCVQRSLQATHLIRECDPWKLKQAYYMHVLESGNKQDLKYMFNCF